MAEYDSQTNDPQQIRREIERTRENMSQTVRALETQLNPEHLKQQAVAAIRQGTVGRVEEFADNATRTVKGAGDDVLDTIKHNPIPAALAAFGLGWLWMERRNESKRYSGQYYGAAGNYPYSYEYDPRTGMQHSGSAPRGQANRLREAGSNVQESAGRVVSNVQDTASQVASNVQETAGQVASNVQETAGRVTTQAREQVSEWADSAQQTAARAKTRFEVLFDENPLLIGMAAVAVGAALGMSLPQTPQEDKLMGEARDSLMEKAQTTAKETVDKVQAVAQRAGSAAEEAAQDEAQKQNLSTSGT